MYMAPVQDTLQQQGFLAPILGAENTPGVGPSGAQADMHCLVKDLGVDWRFPPSFFPFLCQSNRERLL
jgi:hypothetical protein